MGISGSFARLRRKGLGLAEKARRVIFKLRDNWLFFFLQGDGYIGCFSASLISDYKFQMQHLTHSVTTDNCIAKCKAAMFSYAALGQGQW